MDALGSTLFWKAVKHHADTCSHITLNSAFLLVYRKCISFWIGNLPGPPFFSCQKELFYFQASFWALEDYTPVRSAESPTPSVWQAAAAMSGDRAVGQVPTQGRHHPPKVCLHLGQMLLQRVPHKDPTALANFFVVQLKQTKKPTNIPVSHWQTQTNEDIVLAPEWGVWVRWGGGHRINN